MENDTAADVQAEADLDELTTDDDLLAATVKGEGITDGTSAAVSFSIVGPR